MSDSLSRKNCSDFCLHSNSASIADSNIGAPSKQSFDSDTNGIPGATTLNSVWISCFLSTVTCGSMKASHFEKFNFSPNKLNLSCNDMRSLMTVSIFPPKVPSSRYHKFRSEINDWMISLMPKLKIALPSGSPCWQPVLFVFLWDSIPTTKIFW